mmetsp:Transcript_48883/g.141602  ORF Transcript_48883/g.141602 Transcript_48883/m.141602 type:complete len:263 (-) Transcript_48883:318-1106(-)
MHRGGSSGRSMRCLQLHGGLACRDSELLAELLVQLWPQLAHALFVLGPADAEGRDAAFDGQEEVEADHRTQHQSSHCKPAPASRDPRGTAPSKTTHETAEGHSAAVQRAGKDGRQVLVRAKRVRGLHRVQEAEAPQGALHVGVGAEPFNDVADAVEDGLDDGHDQAQDKVAFLPGVVAHHPGEHRCCLEEGNEEGAKADGAKGGGAGHLGAAEHREGPWMAVLSVVPPSKDAAICHVACAKDDVSSPAKYEELDEDEHLLRA